MQMDIYYSYACRDTYLAFVWLDRVQKRGQVLDLTWRPFAIKLNEKPMTIGSNRGNRPARN